MAAPNPRDLFRGLKSRLAAATLLALTSTSVFAADIPLRYPPPPPRPPAFLPFTWTGLYLGINGGYGWGRVDTINQDGDTLSFNPKGGLVGGTVGFNYQWTWFVAGVEGDLDWSGMRWNQTSTISDDAFLGVPPTASFTVNYKNNVLSTFAARFGVAADHALFYAKAGGAWTRETFNFSGSDPVLGTLSGSNSFTRVGWMAGAGVEYAVTNNLTLRAEYNYIDFGSTSETLTLSASLAGPTTATINSKLTMNVVKFGVNWLFNGR
jgi:outer membrane immunogenic protein